MVEALTMSVLAAGRSPPLAVLHPTHARVRSAEMRGSMAIALGVALCQIAYTPVCAKSSVSRCH